MDGMIYVVGIGPGKKEGMTLEAEEILEKCDIIVGYKTYVDLIKDSFPEKEFYANGMTMEIVSLTGRPVTKLKIENSSQRIQLPQV